MKTRPINPKILTYIKEFHYMKFIDDVCRGWGLPLPSMNDLVHLTTCMRDIGRDVAGYFDGGSFTGNMAKGKFYTAFMNADGINTKYFMIHMLFMVKLATNFNLKFE